ncbi:YtxH domain-containing protein [Bacillus sp. FJAT-42376]|uniref:YtxH domain-containing protein n=1 Tax=Bacillus sp. FJAT-42376 TaxID=2014076 RepID=UPI0013DDDBB3|nr:YtxH domain-containing protein [Bacillus sp. FJAT-42376]
MEKNNQKQSTTKAAENTKSKQQANGKRAAVDKNFLSGSLVGALAGIGATLLLAPKTGKDMRSSISKQSSSVLDSCKQFGGSTKDKFSSLKEKGTAKTQEAADKIKKSALYIVKKENKSDEQGAAENEQQEAQAQTAVTETKEKDETSSEQENKKKLQQAVSDENETAEDEEENDHEEETDLEEDSKEDEDNQIEVNGQKDGQEEPSSDQKMDIEKPKPAPAQTAAKTRTAKAKKTAAPKKPANGTVIKNEDDTVQSSK